MPNECFIRHPTIETANASRKLAWALITQETQLFILASSFMFILDITHIIYCAYYYFTQYMYMYMLDIASKAVKAIFIDILQIINQLQVCLVKPDTFKPESIINRTFFGRRIRARQLKLRCCKPESAINQTLFGEPTCPVLTDTPVLRKIGIKVTLMIKLKPLFEC